MLLGLVVIGTTGAGINNKLYHKRGVSGGPLGGDIFVRGNCTKNSHTPPPGGCFGGNKGAKGGPVGGSNHNIWWWAGYKAG